MPFKLSGDNIDCMESFPDGVVEHSVEYLSQTTEDEYFNNVVGCIEDMLLDEEFLKMQNEFIDKYWKEFEDSDENKLVYTNIFEEYQRTTEQFIETYLHERIEDFNMEKFIHEVLIRKDKLEGEIFEMLFTFTDFLAFKEMFLDYKAMKEGRIADFSSDISVTQIPVEESSD